MRWKLGLAAATAVCTTVLAATSAVAQKQGGTLRVSSSANPSSLSVHEEVSITTVQVISAVFSNLVTFDPMNKINSPETIIPELAESAYGDATARIIKRGSGWSVAFVHR